MNGTRAYSAAKGFTLIELIIVVAVLAIIMAIAIPTFSEQLSKSRRSEAISGLQQLSMSMERWRADHPGYAQGSSTDTYPSQAATDNYTFSITAADGTSYSLKATNQGAQANDRCGAFTFSVALGAISKSAGESNCWND